MCDQYTEADNQAVYARELTRRRFSLVAGGAAVGSAFAGCAPGETLASERGGLVSESDVTIATPDGEADAFFAHPDGRATAAVLIWPDILGLRPAFKMMAKRLAGDGYAALVVNPYYRQAQAPLVEVGDSFSDPDVRAKIIPYARALNQDTNRTDARAFIDWLDEQPAVDTSRGVGTMGYCMGGPMTFVTAHERADRVRAGGSYHGGGLVTGAPTSPHRLVGAMRADFLVAIAENDHEKAPQVEGVLRETFAKTDNTAEIEVYAGTKHGWCPPDSRVYDEAQADKAWARTLALFETALA